MNELEKVDTTEIQTESSDLVAKANSRKITTPEEYEDAVQDQIAAGKLIKKIEKTFEPQKVAANKLHKMITGQIKDLTDPIKEARKINGPKLTEWEDEIDRLARIRQREEEAAIRKAQQEKEAAIKKEAEEKAKFHEALGDEDAALQALEDADAAVHDVAMQTETAVGLSSNSFKTAVPIKGTRRTTTYKGVVVDVSKIPTEYMMTVPNQAKIDAAVNLAKGQIVILGVRIDIESKRQ